MAHITLVLPFALPLPEFAPDMVRALQAPALAALLSRTSSARRAPKADTVHALPHETWLARELGLADDGRTPFAVAAMRGLNLDPGAGRWHIVTPAHIQIARSHLMMADTRQVSLDDADGRALFDAASTLCEEIGHELRYGDAHTWFLRADDWTGFDTASPDTVANMDLTDFMPKGAQAQAYRRLQNEVQMAWHAHPVNAAREAKRLPVVNAFWLWGASGGASVQAQQPVKNMASYAVPGWLAALGQQRLPSLDRLDDVLAQGGLLVAGNLGEAALAADWHGWLQGMQHLEDALFAPLLAALKDGRVRELRLVLSSREGLADYTTTAMAQRKFWRRPTLDSLT
ncbi:hypothetical protein SOM61_12650 [Massilia sp. CFBP9012]|uniref:hypothetical protein n=1 Tax=Massilia sp. CFBP9012 TaxID=3096531 RepID=UPI002A6B49DB|nr:hypothetical protein [Massilia sp. CFBP9012]MDY0975819.1 hypothetical protein [Massilia sp. CFBP9012]